MSHAVRYVAEQKLLPSRHAGIADHENIDSFLLGGADDRGSRFGIHHDYGTARLPDDLPHLYRQLIVGGSRACPCGCAEFCGSRIVRNLHLYHEQLCVIAAGAFSTVGANHPTPYGAIFSKTRHTLRSPFMKICIGIDRVTLSRNPSQKFRSLPQC